MSRLRFRRPLALLTAALVAGGLAACGKHPDEDAPVVRAENEGLYLTVSKLKYQVQGSRQLNPKDIQDRYYLRGVPADQLALKSDEVWFGVFMQVGNETSAAITPSGRIEIADTQDEIFQPLELDQSNAFAYRSSEPIPAGEVAPLKDTPAYDTPNRGSLLLFKLTLSALDNRPLELKIEGTTAPQQTGIIDLDV